MIRWDLLGCGAVAVDDLLYVDRFPEPDSKVPVRAEQRQGGGLTATALVAAARLGASTAFLAVLDDDELSRFSVQALESEGVDCSPIMVRAGARPFHSRIIVDLATGGRTIIYSADGVTFPQPADFSEELIRSCRVLFLDHHGAAAGTHVLEAARAHGVPVVCDIERILDRSTEMLLERADHLIIGVALGRQVTGRADPAEIAAGLAKPDRACCAVTAGAQGCWYAERGSPVRHFPAFTVRVVDTTGCGDVFHGAYAACIARGETVDRAIRVATAAAGLKATQPGGRAGIPDRATVERFLEVGPGLGD
jgi:sugar/nucleoside kinase (ribokinase family)